MLGFIDNLDRAFAVIDYLQNDRNFVHPYGFLDQINIRRIVLNEQYFNLVVLVLLHFRPFVTGVQGRQSACPGSSPVCGRSEVTDITQPQH